MPLLDVLFIKEYLDRKKEENVNENSDNKGCHNHSTEVEGNEKKGYPKKHRDE